MSLLAIPTSNVSVRVATMGDLPFIDALQKQHHKQLGFFPRAQMEEYIRAGWILVACQESDAVTKSRSDGVEDASALRDFVSPSLRHSTPVGYVASRDRYLKRDELGAIFQMCVAPGAQRKFVAATLLQAVFDRAPYGCKLFCCWCAQDIEANHFWEAMGFVPLAYRAGGKVRHSVTSSLRHSVTSARVHIFWQKRIRADDTTTPYWFPSQTTGGAIGAGRIVLPIPPGTHWSDAKPLILPGSVESGESREERAERKRLPSSRTPKPDPRTPRRVVFGAPPPMNPAPQAPPAPSAPVEKAPKPKAPKAKNDPRMIAAARELRDRWLEKVNSGEAEGLVPQIAVKYDVRRALGATAPQIPAAPARLLEAA